MKDEIRDKLKTLPTFVLDSIYENYTTEAITKIREEYLEDDDDRSEALKNVIGLTMLKDIRVEQLFDVVKEGLKLDEEDANDVALIIFIEIFYPINNYFPGIEDEILRLGGEIPKEKPRQLTEQLLKREEEMEKMKELEEEKERKRMADTIVSRSVEDLVNKFKTVGEQQIGSQESIILKSMASPMKPLIKYWLKDYREKMGYYRHSNIERVQYVYHDKNTKNMNEEERRQLNLVLKSVDEKNPLPYSTKTKKIDFSKIEEE